MRVENEKDSFPDLFPGFFRFTSGPRPRSRSWGQPRSPRVPPGAALRSRRAPSCSSGKQVRRRLSRPTR
jgi:hypothetical protein